MLLVTCLVSLAHCDRLEELEELLEAEYDNFTLLCNSTLNNTNNAGFLGGFSKFSLLVVLAVTRCLSAAASSITVILVSEIGDKTFFIAAIL